jgi:hypothetical protein
VRTPNLANGLPSGIQVQTINHHVRACNGAPAGSTNPLLVMRFAAAETLDWEKSLNEQSHRLAGSSNGYSNIPSACRWTTPRTTPAGSYRSAVHRFLTCESHVVALSAFPHIDSTRGQLGTKIVSRQSEALQIFIDI